MPLEKAKQGLYLLKQAGMQKINFAGGEPFTDPDYLGSLCEYCRNELNIATVSIISNGSLLTEEWMEQWHQCVDVIGISIDSSVPGAAAKVGRIACGPNAKDQIQVAKYVSVLCAKYKVGFKVNTVVGRFNLHEDMRPLMKELAPFRWKVFQILILKSERSGSQECITTDEFNDWVARHQELSPVAESNKVMANSYLVLDEQLRFMDSSSGKKVPSSSILDVGVEVALQQVTFDSAAFDSRKGDWYKSLPKHNTAQLF
jgi:radical S-adenosyl methionine domain-containing protein 2